MNTAFYSHPACRQHDMGEGHPECPARLDAITDHLRATGLDLALDFREAPEARPEQLVRAHAAAYVAGVTDLLLPLLARPG
jgi:acetoin utilization deacetylase AcuC-like enzyme